MKPLHTELHPALRRLAKCLSDRKGSIFVVVGAALPVLIGVLGLGADAGIWYANKRAAQTQTDAAAISGAFEKARLHNNTAIVAAAQKEAGRNGFQSATPNTLTIHNPPTSGSRVGDVRAVEVIMSTQQPLLFAQFFLDNVAIKTRAVASVQTTGTACVLALEQVGSSALTNSGTVNVNMPGCVLASNSTSATAIDIGGGATINADSLWTPGNYTQSGSSSVTLTKPPTVGAWAIDDPYANVPPPSAPPCVNWVQAATINQGSYCGLDFAAGTTVTFNPGTYYIVGKDFKVNNSVTIRCNCDSPPGAGVTIVLTGVKADRSDTGTVVFNGASDVQLKAPTTGTYAGLVFFQDPVAPPSSKLVQFNGGNNMSLQGAIYFPKRSVQWAGNNSPSGPTCTQIIGRTVTFTGSATIQNTGCEAAGVKPLSISGVRVVE